MIKSVGRYPVVVIHDEAYKGSVATRNEMSVGLEGNILYATDDITFYPGAIELAHEDLAKHFPDTDGVIGFTQNKAHHPSGVALVGHKFVKRYPENKLFNPEIHHFAAQHIYNYANRLGKFHKSMASLRHTQDFSDRTAIEARRKKDDDLKVNTPWPT